MTATASAAAEEAIEDAPAPATPPRSDKQKSDSRPKKQPRYHVVLWNDDDHTYQYVVAMLQKLFGHPPEKGYLLAKEVDSQGRVIVLTTTKEHAELKRDQIHAFGADRLLRRSKGAMSASIEPEPE
jgi:ATP-dependent Clp protease adaptor protein ClpS